MERSRVVWRAGSALTLALLLAGCAAIPDIGGNNPGPAVPPVGEVKPAYTSDSLVGRWGIASFHQEKDRARTEKEARSQCRQAYTIAKGPRDGVMMHVADDPKLYELKLKGAPGGKTYLGFEAPPGHEQDREILSFNEPVLVMRWVDPEVQKRYGTMVYVRCP
jgi:hypothetical protein